MIPRDRHVSGMYRGVNTKYREVLLIVRYLPIQVKSYHPVVYTQYPGITALSQ